MPGKKFPEIRKKNFPFFSASGKVRTPFHKQADNPVSGNVPFPATTMQGVILIMPRFRLATIVLLGCLGTAVPLQTAEPPVSFLDATDTPVQGESRLLRAWREYGLSNWEPAADLFQQVLRDRDATPAARLQAEFGLIYIEQYRMPGFNPERALAQYTQLLAKIEPGTPDHAVIRRQMAECLLDQRTPDYTVARTYLREILDSPGAPELTRAVVVMDLARSYVLEGMTFNEDEKKDTYLLHALAILTQYKPELEGTHFPAVAHQMSGEILLQLGDYRRGVRELEGWQKSGIRSIRLFATTLFRIARINEVELEDTTTAALYYLRLADEVPSDSRAFWARERVAEIAQGKDNHFAHPPLTRIPQRDIHADLVKTMNALFGDNARLPDPEGKPEPVSVLEPLPDTGTDTGSDDAAPDTGDDASPEERPSEEPAP